VVDGPINPKTGEGFGVGTKAYAEAEAGLDAGMLMLPSRVRIQVDGMAEAIRRHPAGKLVLDVPGNEYEVTMIADLQVLGSAEPGLILRVKTRPDVWNSGERMIADLKKVRDASQDAFSKDIARYHYHGQAALYRHVSEALGQPIDSHVFPVVEDGDTPCWSPSGPTYAAAVYMLGDESIKAGWHSLVPALVEAARCYRDNVWPGYPTTIDTIDVPPWAMGPIWE